MPRTMDKYYQNLLMVKTKVVNNRKPSHEYLTAHTVRKIHKLLRNAFNQGVKWELMSRNPVQNATIPKEEHKERDIWTVETLFKALEVCDDDNLSLALNLAFSCSLRMGEMLGVTWNCIDISERSIKSDCAYIFVNKELQRIKKCREYWGSSVPGILLYLGLLIKMLILLTKRAKVICSKRIFPVLHSPVHLMIILETTELCTFHKKQNCFL